jgi:GYF domain 2
MKKYFIRIGNEQKGPYTIEEMEDWNLTYDTYIWSEGFNDWTKLSNVPELIGIVSVVPPVFKEKHKSNGLRNAACFVAVMILGFYISSYYDQTRNNSNDTIPYTQQQLNEFRTKGYIDQSYAASIQLPQPTYEEKLESIRREELRNAEYLLKVNFDFRYAIFGGNIKINGTLKNNATVANFQQTQVKINYYADKVLLGNEIYVVHGKVKHGEYISFSDKLSAPGATNRLTMNVITAEQANEE